ncbi:MAG TPA: HEPN domain-containing protein [Candidatus Hydrogenedentes bacterium]|nr:HEPN domain-containing protein [Candidatus Hydrogenedentota bacterium]
MDIEKQVAYWRAGSEEDFEVARELVSSGRFRHGLFFGHLAVEKMLKAHVVVATQEVPPRIHNLSLLAEKAGLQVSEEQAKVLEEFNMYQLEGRYGGQDLPPIDEHTAQRDMRRAAEVLEWLKAQFGT